MLFCVLSELVSCVHQLCRSHLRLVPAAARAFDQQVNGVILRHHPDPDPCAPNARRQTHCSEDYSRETARSASARGGAPRESGRGGASRERAWRTGLEAEQMRTDELRERPGFIFAFVNAN